MEDPDGVLGGRDRDSDAEFSTEEGLPGDGADQNAGASRLKVKTCLSSARLG